MINCKNTSSIAKLYTLGSIFVGPLIYVFGYGFTRGGGDYCDGVYYLTSGLIDPRRETEFQNAQIFQATGAIIMLVLGFFIILSLILHSRKEKNKLNIKAILGVALMMIGYIFVIILSGKSGQSC